MLSELTRLLTEALGPDLLSVTLFGSAAESKLRLTSDVNVVLVVTGFQPQKFESLKPHIAAAESAIALKLMILEENEVSQAAEAFSVKFTDIGRRHKVLWGQDIFANLQVPREAVIRRTRQALLNQLLRLRSLWLGRSAREEQLVLLIAETAGPLRSVAATLMELRGTPQANGKEALTKMLTEILGAEGGALSANISRAREKGTLPPGEAELTLLKIMRCVEAIYKEAKSLP